MRSFPGKDLALVIDHSGNALRFLNDTVDFWANGVDELNEATEKDRAARSITPKERKELVCLGCRAVLPPGVSTCVACGRERPRRSSDVTIVSGSTQRVDLAKQASSRKFDFPNHPILMDPAFAHRCFVAWATERKRGDEVAGRRWAAGLFKGVYERWPPREYDHFPVEPDLVTFEVETFCKREMARYSKTKAAA